MPEQTRFHAFGVVLKQYLSNGEPGVNDLRRDIARTRRSPVLTQFCVELHEILQGKLPVPTEEINQEFQRRAAAAVELGELDEDAAVAQFSAAEAYEMCADLWDRLELEVVDADDGGPAVSSAGTNRVLRSPLVPGDPVQALQTWMSLPMVLVFLGGTLLCILAYWAYQRASSGFVGNLLLLLTVSGFLAAAGSAALLWLRRTRYVDPDAFLPKRKDRKRADG
jgi:hypothetical protein